MANDEITSDMIEAPTPAPAPAPTPKPTPTPTPKLTPEKPASALGELLGSAGAMADFDSAKAAVKPVSTEITSDMAEPSTGGQTPKMDEQEFIDAHGFVPPAWQLEEAAAAKKPEPPTAAAVAELAPKPKSSKEVSVAELAPKPKPASIVENLLAWQEKFGGLPPAHMGPDAIQKTLDKGPELWAGPEPEPEPADSKTLEGHLVKMVELGTDADDKLEYMSNNLGVQGFKDLYEHLYGGQPGEGDKIYGWSLADIEFVLEVNKPTDSKTSAKGVSELTGQPSEPESGIFFCASLSPMFCSEPFGEVVSRVMFAVV